MFIIIIITLSLLLGFLRILLPRLRCLVSFYQNRHRLLTWYTDLLSASPTQTIVVHRLGAPRTVVTANPSNVEHILKSNFANFPKGRPFTDLLGDFLGLGIFNSDGDRWAAQRKLASHAFSTRSLRHFLLHVLHHQVTHHLLPALDAAARDNTVLDIQALLRKFSFDTICQVSLGTDKPSSIDLSAALDSASSISAMRGMAPVPAVWKLKRLLNVGAERELKEAVRLVHGCVDDIIRSKKKLSQGADNDNDLLSRMLESGMDDETVRDMVISFLMAGRDTTSSALTWLFWLLTGHREIEGRVVEEASKSGTPGYEDLKGMGYIKACLCEAMRLYPPVVWDSKHAARGDVLPDGTRVGRGDRVTYFQYGMGRMERIWGGDWKEFRPERWFGEGGEAREVSPYEFPVFQAGPRVCLGKEMAYVQMKYVVAEVVRRFVFEPVREEEPVFVPMLTAYMAGGFHVRVRRREEK